MEALAIVRYYIRHDFLIAVLQHEVQRITYGAGRNKHQKNECARALHLRQMKAPHVSEGFVSFCFGYCCCIAAANWWNSVTLP